MAHDGLVAPLALVGAPGVFFLRDDLGGIDVKGELAGLLTLQGAGQHLPVHRRQALQTLPLAHPAQPVARGIRRRHPLQAQQFPQTFIGANLPQILQRPPAPVQHQ